MTKDTEVKTHDLFEFMQQITSEMESEYLRIQKRATEDPGTAGDQGEENWASLLRGWLPSNYTIVTKGRIINHEGVLSPQIDILVLHSSYPERLLDKKVFLAGGVIAAFECKNTIKTQHIPKIIETAKTVKEASVNRKASPYKELQAPIIYGLLSHSHSWKKPKSQPINNLTQQFLHYEKLKISHPKDLIDLVCIADLATWSRVRSIIIGTNYYKKKYKNGKLMIDGALITSLVCHSQGSSNANNKYSFHFVDGEDESVKPFTPIGSLIGTLFEKIANEDRQFREMANYYSAVGIRGTGDGNIRTWDENVFSVETKQKILEGKLTSGRPITEWSNIIC